MAGIRPRIFLLSSFIVFILSGCALGLPDLLNVPGTETSNSDVLIFTATQTLTFTATQPTSTFTLTPTKIGEKTKTNTPTNTYTPSATQYTPTNPAPSNTPTATTYLDGFVSVRLATFHVFIRGCQPSKVKFTTQVGGVERVKFVVLFVRFKSTTGDSKSAWTNFTMNDLGGGTYSYELNPEEMLGLDLFDDPWIQYQLVKTDAGSQVLGRTGIFSNSLFLTTTRACTPTPFVTPGP